MKCAAAALVLGDCNTEALRYVALCMFLLNVVQTVSKPHLVASPYIASMDEYKIELRSSPTYFTTACKI